jgi:hypothetical protein
MFPKLTERLKEEHAQQIRNSRFYIEYGYCETWAPENQNASDDGIKRYSTARRWAQYQAGEITRTKAVELACKRMERDCEKQLIVKQDKLLQAAAAPDVISISVSVEWKHSRTWGYNPTATVTVCTVNGCERYTGTASGCGYDKLSAAVGAALNQSASVLKMLYQIKETALAAMTADDIAAQKKGYTFGSETNRHYIHYGAGYGVLPYFEGGVGIVEHLAILRICGIPCQQQHETRLTNYYYFSKGV